MHTHTHTHTHTFYGPLDSVRDYRGEPVPEPVWILLKQETVSGSDIIWAICKSASRPTQLTTQDCYVSLLNKDMTTYRNQRRSDARL